jgi:hypothetical protein
VSVIADVARTYIELRGYQAQLAAVRRNIDTARRSLKVAQTRLSEGLTNELDVTLAQRQVATFESTVGPLTGQIQSSQYVIAGLLGQFPETLAKELVAYTPAPRFPAKVPIDLPVSLLQRRADIQQAEFEIAAATARVGSATPICFRAWPSQAQLAVRVARAQPSERRLRLSAGSVRRSIGRCWTSAPSMRVSRWPTIRRAKRCFDTRPVC